MKKIIVTGASGHLGFHVAKVLLQKNYPITCLARQENINLLKLKKLGANIHYCNLFDKDTYQHLLTEAEAVFHLAAENTTSGSSPEITFNNTYGLAKAVIDACISAHVKTIVYTSSVVVLGRSSSKSRLINENDRTAFIESPYVRGKVEAEKYIEQIIQNQEVDIRRLYPAWIVGKDDPKSTPPHTIIRNYVEKGQFFYFKGGISLCEVEEVAKAHVSAYEKGEKNGTYVLGGDNITFKTFYSILSDYTPHARPFLYIPKAVIVAGAYVSKILLKMFRMPAIIEPGYARSVFGNYSWYDSTKAITRLNYHIIPARQILSEAVEEAYKRITGTLTLGFQYKPYADDHSDEPKLLITGVPGWLGNRMVDIMINGNRKGNFKTNRPVRLLVEPRFSGMLNLPGNFEIFYGDIRNPKDVEEAVRGIDTVFHLAGAIYPKKIKTLYEVNTKGTENLVNACIRNGVRRIIYMSTDSVCGHGNRNNRIFDESTPATPYKHYGRSKYLAEKYILDHTKQGKIDGTSLRGFWFFGPFAPSRQFSFFKMFFLPRQLVFGNGKNFRSISHVDDIVQAFFKAEKNQESIGKWYWICGNENKITIDEFFAKISDKLGIKYRPLHIPVWICKLFEFADSLLGKFGILVSSLHAAGKFYYDIAGKNDAAKRDFDFSPEISMDEAIEELTKQLK